MNAKSLDFKDNKEEEGLIRRCLKNSRKAQKELYERYAPLMKMVCLRYLFEKQLAEEVMNRGFFKVFTKLKEFKGQGSFEGWIRRIMVNESINENHKKKIIYETEESREQAFLEQVPEVESTHELNHIMAVISSLPNGYRIIFNLSEVEGYSHKEIAQKLGITESSSRSQLTRAKKLLRKKLKDIKLF